MRQLFAWLFAVWLTTAPVFAADNAVVVTPGAGVTMRSKDVGSLVQSMIEIPGDTAGTPLATAPGTPNASFALPVQGVTGGTAVPISAASLPLPTGGATSALQTTINTTLGSPFQAGGSIGNASFAVTQATSSSLKGQVDPLTIGTWGIVVSTQNSATPTNGHLVEGQFNTSPTTISSGNVSPLQLDSAGNLLVNVKAGGAGGGAVTMVSGAVASGAYSSGSLASGAGTDGWDVTEGTKADAAWSSGSGSVIAILKTISGNTGAVVPSQSPAVPIGGISICDGANGTTNPCTTAATVKAASTQSAAADKSLIVQINPNQPSPSNPFPVNGQVNVTQSDCSIALTTGGTAQNIITAAATIHGFRIMNIDASAGSGEPVWMSFTGTAVAAAIASYPLAAPTATTFAGAGSYSAEFASGINTSVSVIAVTTGHKISCTKW